VTHKHPPQSSPIPLTQFITVPRLQQAKSAAIESHLSAESWLADARLVKSVYIHVPFCFHKCHYCDFYSIAGGEDQYDDFINQLSTELEYVGEHLNEIETIFVGGGTPTIFDINLFDAMLHAIATYIPRTQACEWTIEANPETVTGDKANAMALNGVNRVSIGAQSFDLGLLKALERWHDPSSVTRAVEFVRDAGIENINLDIIYAIPTETELQLQQDLSQVLALRPTHLSCYSLIYEPNTPLRTRLDRGDVQRIAHELEATMFDTVREVLLREGYEHYEISNFAKSGYTCKHNIAYWTDQSWWPFGPSASGHLAGRRWKNTPRISDYICGSPLPPIVDVERLCPDRSAGESFMVGLRMLQGMEERWVETLIEQSTNNWRRDVIEQYIQQGLLQWQDSQLSLTLKGLRYADTVILALLMQDETMTDTNEQLAQ
jgi:oxygen-independent coproporphyrinogen-3 oxidase